MKTDFTSITHPFSNKINVNGGTYLYFGGTAYLGIPQNQKFISIFIEGIKKFGLNNGTSRTNNIQLGIYSEVERVAAERFKSESSLITSSGYLAAQLTIKALSKAGEVIYAPASHPALWLEDQPIDNRSFSKWAKETAIHINKSRQKNWVIISNSMNNLLPEIHDFSFLTNIDSSNHITLVVDDSHGIGINNNGLGAYSGLPNQKNIENVVIASMAKALGVDSGFVLASTEIVNLLKNTNEFSGASPSAAAGLYAFSQSSEIYKNELSNLQKNITLFSKHLNSDWKFAPGFPAFYIDDEHIPEKLLKQNMLISSFPYPTKISRPINRIILSSLHTPDDISALLSAIA